MTLNKEELKNHLESRSDQLTALINSLKMQGEKHPQYSQLSMLEDEKRTVDSQLTRLQEIIIAQNKIQQ